MNHTFTLVLEGDPMTAEQAERLYEAGCDDATLVTRGGRSLVVFDREADRLEEAIETASRDVQSAGREVSHVEMDAPVAAAG
jgi:phosphoribosylamine-glycine ligase